MNSWVCTFGRGRGSHWGRGRPGPAAHLRGEVLGFLCVLEQVSLRLPSEWSGGGPVWGLHTSAAERPGRRS